MMLNNILIHIMIQNQIVMQIQSLVMTQCNLHTCIYTATLLAQAVLMGRHSQIMYLHSKKMDRCNNTGAQAVVIEVY